ncbi:hypothetical protein GJAV_G00249450 [Gymnothorax javanicus]|nr:hypothetical protein GJAV_G00249450 [Gymnothorax javanicus]
METGATETGMELGCNVTVDMDKDNSEPDTPIIFENLENGPTKISTLEEEPGILVETTEPSTVCAGDALLRSSTSTGDSPQKTGLHDNGKKTEETPVRSSSPVGLSPPSPPLANDESLESPVLVDTAEACLRLEGVELKEEWQDEDFPRPLPEEEEEDLVPELFICSPIPGKPGTPSYGLNSDSKAKKKLEAPEISLTLDLTGSSVPSEEMEERTVIVAEGTPSFGLNSDGKAKKKLEVPEISLTLNQTGSSGLSDELEESTGLDVEDLDTPSDNSNEFDWEDDLPKPKTMEVLQEGLEEVQESTAAEEREESRRWRTFRIGEQEHRVDMKGHEGHRASATEVITETV